jgi:ribosomal-protein-alanine N-acetyltransferase
MVIERQAYPFPWSSGNFKDSLTAGYEMSVLKERGVMIGYLVWMAVMDEAHLLNLALSPARHRRGLGNAMMKHFIGEARSRGMKKILLEVRPSNHPAIGLYRRFGFGEIGLRRGYYPNAVSDQGKVSEPVRDRREDAIVMQLDLAEAASVMKERLHA